jgi:hypothetical protein
LLAGPKPGVGADGRCQVTPPSSAAGGLEPTVPRFALHRPKEEG